VPTLPKGLSRTGTTHHWQRAGSQYAATRASAAEKKDAVAPQEYTERKG
jgi:hypothetical protein